MAINIHTDADFEKHLNWLCRRTGKTKTALLKELVLERYRQQKAGFRFGGLRLGKRSAQRSLQTTLKEIDRDHDLD